MNRLPELQQLAREVLFFYIPPSISIVMDYLLMYQQFVRPPARWLYEEIDSLLEFVLANQDDYCSERKPALLKAHAMQWARDHETPERSDHAVSKKMGSLIRTVTLIDHFNSVYGGGSDPSVITVDQPGLQAVAECIGECMQRGKIHIAYVLTNFANKPFLHYGKVKRIMELNGKAESTSLVSDIPQLPGQPFQPSTLSGSSIAAWVDSSTALSTQSTLATPPASSYTPAIWSPAVCPPLSISSRASSAAAQQLKRPSASCLQPGPPSFPSTSGLQPVHPSFPSQEGIPASFFASDSGLPGPDSSFLTSGLQPVHPSFPSHEPSTSALQPSPFSYHHQLPWAGNLQTNSLDVASESGTHSASADIRFLREMQLTRQEQPFPKADESFHPSVTKVISAFVGVAGALNNLSGTLQQTLSQSPEMINRRLAEIVAQEPIDVEEQAKLYLYFAEESAAAAPLPDMSQELRSAIFREVLASNVTI